MRGFARLTGQILTQLSYTNPRLLNKAQSSYNLRRKTPFVLPRCKKNRYRNTFIPFQSVQTEQLRLKILFIWNILIQTIFNIKPLTYQN
jgi:hypothetical protein